MVELCPTCKRPLGHRLYKILNTTEQDIFDTIIASGGEGITQREIADKIYGHRLDGGPLNARNCIGVYLFKMRKKLQNTNYHIVCYANRYRIENRGICDA